MDGSEFGLEALNRKVIYDNIVLICVINTFVVIGFCGNILSVFFFGFKERKHTNDALIALLTTSNAIANIVALGELAKYINYLTFQNEIGCKVHYFLTHSFTKISGVMLLFIALDRHRLLCHPFSWQLTPKIISISLSSVVLYLVSSSAVQLRIAHIERLEIVRYDHNGTVLEDLKRVELTRETNRTELVLDEFVTNKTCLKFECGNMTSAINGTKLSHVKELNKTSAHATFMTAHVCTNMGTLNETDDMIREIFNVSDLVVTVTSFLLILYCYGTTVKVMFDHWKQRRKLSRQNNERFRADIKITLMTVTITVMSLLSFTPYYVAKALQNRTLVSSDQIRLRIISASYMINNTVDPYVLLAFIPNFRRFVKHLFCCGGSKRSCTRPPQQEEII